MTLLERFETKYIPEPNTGCWLWTATVTPKGYGQIGFGGRRGPILYAHRVSWEAHNGPIPADVYVLHKCDNPPCVNPQHLFLGTPRDNTVDAIVKGRIDFNAMQNRATKRRVINGVTFEADRATAFLTGGLTCNYELTR